MAKVVAEGTTFTFGGSPTAAVRSYDLPDESQEIDMSDLSSDTKEYAEGMADPRATLEIVGTTTIARGDTGDLVLTLPDASTITRSDMRVSKKSERGAIGEPHVTTLEFVPNFS